MKCFKLKLIHICIQPHIHDSARVWEYKRKCVSRNLKQRKLQGATPIYWDHIGSLCVSGVTASHYNIILTMKCNNTCQNPLIIALNLGSMGLLVPNIGGLRRYIQISKYSDIQIFKKEFFLLEAMGTGMATESADRRSRDFERTQD